MQRAPSGRPALPSVSAQVRGRARAALSLSDEGLLAQCDESFFVGGGPGGQHRNKTASGVRLRHPATELVVTATERRSQVQNRGVALQRLRARLALLAREPTVRKPTRATRASKERRLDAKRRTGRKKAQRRDALD